MELSMRWDESWGPEMRRLLGEFTEMPENIKLFHLSKLSTDEDKEEFRDMLGSLPMESVRFSIHAKFSFRTHNLLAFTKKQFMQCDTSWL